MADFIFPDTSCEYHTAEMSRSETPLQFVGENFLSQVLRDLTRKDTLLHLLAVNGEGRWDGLGHSDRETVEFKIVGVMRKKDSRAAILDFERASVTLFRVVLSKIPWESAVEGICLPSTKGKHLSGHGNRKGPAVSAEYSQVRGAWWDSSQSTEAAGRCCKRTLSPSPTQSLGSLGRSPLIGN